MACATTAASSATLLSQASSKNTIPGESPISAMMNAPSRPEWPPALYGRTYTVIFGRRETSSRCPSWPRITSSPPTGRCSTPSSSRTYSSGGSSRSRISCRSSPCRHQFVNVILAGVRSGGQDRAGHSLRSGAGQGSGECSYQRSAVTLASYPANGRNACGNGTSRRRSCSGRACPAARTSHPVAPHNPVTGHGARTPPSPPATG